MKAKYIIITVAALLLAAGCAKDTGPEFQDPSWDKAGEQLQLAVTVRQDATGTVYFQKGNNVRFFPRGGYEFTGECRAFGSFIISPQEQPGYGHICDVEWLEEIDKGPVIISTAASFADCIDGIDVDSQSSITSIEDGYLTVNYYSWWGAAPVHHDIALLYAGERELFLVNNANGDAREVYTQGLVYFDINDLFPAAEEEPLTITLKWITTEGKETSAKFGFISRK